MKNLTVVLVVFVAAVAWAFEPWDEQADFAARPNPLAVTGEVLAGCGSAGLGAFLGYTVAFKYETELETIPPLPPIWPEIIVPVTVYQPRWGSPWVFAPFAVGSAIGASIGVLAVGKLAHQDGSPKGASVGALAGGLVGWAGAVAATWGERESDPTVEMVWKVLPVIVVPTVAGAVLGYNIIKRPDEDDFDFSDRRLGLPSIGLSLKQDRDGTSTTVLECWLVRVRF
jgi:hypothetical protein